MYSKYNILLLVLSVWWSCLVVTTKCQSCEEPTSSYVYSSFPTTCKNIVGKFPEFSKVPTYIKCIDCNIPVLYEDTITYFKGDTFNLSDSHVRNISSTAFKSFQSPERLHKFILNNNEIVYISPQIFSSFSTLDEINLKNNSLSHLEDATFENTSVLTLDLSYNHISTIGTNFVGLKVNKLNLSSNEIRVIEQNAFDNVTFWTGRNWRSNIQQLDLSNNLIEKIFSGAFKKCSSDNSLRSLFLQRNSLIAIDNNTFSQLNYLRTLMLDDNYISNLYIDSFKGLKSLTTLSLKSNYLQKIPIGMFADLEALDTLDLSQNHLTTLTAHSFTGLAFLSKLNISHNNLRTLDESHILPLGKLISLDITETALHELNLQTIMEHHYRLRILVLNDNFWTCKNLVQMYKQMNERMGGFDYPSRHFDVPNLHGIACSRTELSSDSYSDMTFDEFLGVISQDRVFEDLFDDRIKNDYADLDKEDIIISTLKSIRGIFYMHLVITLLVLLLFVKVIFGCVCQYLYNRNILRNNKYSIKFAPKEENVLLI